MVKPHKLNTVLRVFKRQCYGWYIAQSYAYFNHWNDERKVNVNFSDNDWNDNYWFGGRNFLGSNPSFSGRIFFC